LLNAAKIKAVAQTGWFKWTVNIAFSALFVYWLISYDIVDALSAVAVADLTLHTLAAGLVLILMQFLRSWRLSCLLAEGPAKPAVDTYRISVHHNFFAMLIPAKVGEFSFVLLARKLGLNAMQASKTLIQMRSFDLAFVLLLFAVSGYTLVEMNLPVLWIAVAGGGLFLILLLARRYVLMGLGWLALPLTAITPVAALSAGIMTCQVLGTLLVTRAVGVDFDTTQVLSIVGAGMLAFALPIGGVGNVGPYHAVWLIAAHQYAIDPGLALAAGTIYHLLAFVCLGVQALIVRTLLD
jgi:hypothetical protein